MGFGETARVLLFCFRHFLFLSLIVTAHSAASQQSGLHFARILGVEKKEPLSLETAYARLTQVRREKGALKLFVEDEKSITMPASVVAKCATLQNLLSNTPRRDKKPVICDTSAVTADGVKSLVVYASIFFERERSAFLSQLDDAKFLALLHAADFFSLEDGLYTELAVRALDTKMEHFRWIEQWFSPAQVRVALKEKQLLLPRACTVQQQLGDHKAAILMALFKQKNEFKIDLNLDDFSEHPEARNALLLQQNGAKVLFNVAHRSLTSLQGLQAVRAKETVTELCCCNNSIETLPETLFDDMPALQELWCSHNRIQKIPHIFFASAQHLTHIDLSHNNITELTPGVFRGLVTVGKLDLSYNRITDIAPFTFRGLARLEELNLAGNCITEIEQDAFAEMWHLRTLDLQSNQIDTIDTETFSELPEDIEEIYILNNSVNSAQITRMKANLDDRCFLICNRRDYYVVFSFEGWMDRVGRHLRYHDEL